MSKARVSLHLPVSLKTAAEQFAEKDGVSLNQYISVALAEKIGARGAAEFFAKRAKSADVTRAVNFLEDAPDVPPGEGDEIAP